MGCFLCPREDSRQPEQRPREQEQRLRELQLTNDKQKKSLSAKNQALKDAFDMLHRLDQELQSADQEAVQQQQQPGLGHYTSMTPLLVSKVSSGT